jgi:hypothetical protein
LKKLAFDPGPTDAALMSASMLYFGFLNLYNHEKNATASNGGDILQNQDQKQGF